MSKISLRGYQVDLVTQIRAALAQKKRSVLVVLPTGGGKCLAAGTPVLMYDGTIKPVETIGVGELIMGPDSRPRRVLSLARGRELLYRVTQSNGDPYVVNESHILSLRTKSGAIKNIPVREYINEPAHWQMRYFGWRVPRVLNGDLTPELGQITVEPIGEGDYYGFEIDGDHLFMLGDFTVTHNTYTFCYISDSAAQRGNIIYIIVHRKELLLQASKSLKNLGIDHGMISPHFTPQLHKKVQVASVDTLLNRLKKNPEKYRPTIVIYDEAHHVVDGNKWGAVYRMLGNPVMLGFTATPERGDGIGLGVQAGGLFDEMVIGPTIQDLIDMGNLIAPVVYTTPELPDLTGLKKNSKGEYQPDEAAARVDKPAITGCAVDHYSRICPGARTIVFCCNINHARHVVEQFNAAGFRFALLVGEPAMKDAERTRVIEMMESGELDGAVTVDLVSEGFDLPALECCIMLRPTGSVSLFLQQVGRVLRPSDGKTTAYLLDHVGNVGRWVDGKFVPKHGLPTAERDWSLEGRKKKKRGEREVMIALKQCPQCYHAFEPADTCPNCGHDMRPKGRELEQIDGELKQITPEEAAIISKQKRVEMGRAQSMEELLKIEKDRGYKSGWARMVFEARKRKKGGK